jgi:putative Ca2+/H+ antiporter (TMEM165/GDT1 family)
MDFAIIALVFAVVFIAELPDKSLFASLVLGSRFPSWYVWLGAASAFLVHVIIAVTAGKLLTFLPHRILEAVITLLFLAGALLLFFGKHGIENESPKKESTAETSETMSFWKVYATSFGVVFLGEWGDITQIATANYAAKYHNPWSVGIGAVLGLWSVTALAVTVGAKALNLVPAKVLQRTTGTIMLLFAIFTGISALRG